MIKRFLIKIPFLVFFYRFCKSFIHRKKINKILKSNDNEKIFEEIYSTNFWGDEESVSGPGSSAKNSDETVNLIKEIIIKYNIISIVDAPCGDFKWMKKVLDNLPNIKYTGIDIVKKIVDINNEKFSSKNTIFFKKNILEQTFPKCDLIICRDFLIHLSFKDIIKFKETLMRSDFNYIIVTGYESANKKILNKDIATGDFRIINIFSNPINFSTNYISKNEDHRFDNKTAEEKSYLYIFEKNKLL